MRTKVVSLLRLWTRRDMVVMLFLRFYLLEIIPAAVLRRVGEGLRECNLMSCPVLLVPTCDALPTVRFQNGQESCYDMGASPKVPLDCVKG